MFAKALRREAPVVVAVLAMVLPLLPVATATAQTPIITEMEVVAGSNTARSDRFGAAAAVSGDTIVVGAPSEDVLDGCCTVDDAGAAYVFQFNAATDQWEEQARLTASDLAASNFFGTSVDIDGDIIVVGTLASRVYFFERTGTTWNEVARVLSAEVTIPRGSLSNRFGEAVAIDGDTAVVGDPNTFLLGNSDVGAAIVLRNTGPTAATWTQEAALHRAFSTFSTGGTPRDDFFGRSVDISGNTIVVGAPGDDFAGFFPLGRVYFFERNGTTWSEDDSVTALDITNHTIGEAVAISGDTAVIGVRFGFPTSSTTQAGLVHVLQRTGVLVCCDWLPVAELAASDGLRLDEFGSAVAISADQRTIVVGAPSDDHSGANNPGSAYQFVRAGPITTWTEEAKLIASGIAGETVAFSGNEFGGAVAVDDGDTVVVGAPLGNSPPFPACPCPGSLFDTGAAYIYDFRPPPVPEDLDAGFGHTCALAATGRVKCWGDNSSGQLGNGTTGGIRIVPVDVLASAGGPPLSGVTDVAAGRFFTCALTMSGGVKCWGDNSSGQLGNGTTVSSPTPVDVLDAPGGVPLTGAAALSVGSNSTHACVLTTSDGAQCWGSNANGAIGDGMVGGIRTTPVDVMSPGGVQSGLASVTVGGVHTCARTTTGRVKCWGRSGDGAVGDGSVGTVHFTTVDVLVSSGGPALSGIAAVAAGFSHTCALTNPGGVKCWGQGDVGQVGDGTATRTNPFPVDVLVSPGGSALSGMASVAAGFIHSCGVTTTGGVKCWGGNGARQLGDSTFTNRPTPVDVVVSPGGPPLGDIAAVAAGSDHTCALTNPGGVKCWGTNFTGQLGDGTTTLSSIPVDVLLDLVDTDNDGIGDSFEQGFGGLGVTIDNVSSSPPDSGSASGDAASGSTIATGELTVSFPPGTTAETPSTAIQIRFVADGPGSGRNDPAVEISGASLPAGTSKTIEMPFGNTDAVCIVDTATAMISTFNVDGTCSSGDQLLVMIPADGGSNSTEGRTVSRNGNRISITGLTNTVSVTILTPAGGTQDLIDFLQRIVDSNPGTPLADKVEDALAKARTALEELNKEPPDNQAAVGNIEGAVGDLEAAIGLDPTLDGDLTDVMSQLAGIARQLAVAAMDEAIAVGGDPGKIDEAQQALDDGDGLRDMEMFKDAVAQYKDAVSKAEGA